MHSMSHTSLPITRYSINPCPCTCPRLYALAPCAEVSVLNVHRDCVSASRPACLLTFPPESTRIYVCVYVYIYTHTHTSYIHTIANYYFQEYLKCLHLRLKIYISCIFLWKKDIIEFSINNIFFYNQISKPRIKKLSYLILYISNYFIINLY